MNDDQRPSEDDLDEQELLAKLLELLPKKVNAVNESAICSEKRAS